VGGGAPRAETASPPPPQEACQNLVDAALEAGGYDNVAVGIFAVRPPAGPLAEPQTATRRIDIAGLEAPEAAATRMIALREDPP
jgi:hypothetical protein